MVKNIEELLPVDERALELDGGELVDSLKCDGIYITSKGIAIASGCVACNQGGDCTSILGVYRKSSEYE